MAKPSEEISKYNSSSNGKTDANLANDALHLGGIPADEWAAKRFVQQYHDNKEEILREYIDTQDLAKLQEAKNYVDTAIRNQDFSAFAKLTDLQALSATLTARIEECARNCANNLNTRIQAVVADTNANFANVNTSIQQLNANDEQLFQSVSSGKRKVAAAITDKGVNTASNATFDTMASNIRKIETGGGDYDENFVNTGDATATASDIFLGKTAYVKGQKVYGTYDDFYPTYGTDTSSGNVTASDIPWGKIAFSGGQAITGQAYHDPSIEAVYAANPNEYELHNNSVCMGQDPDSENIVICRKFIEFSKDTNYCVSAVWLNEYVSAADFYIESHAVNDNGLIIHGSSGATNNSIVYKKYRYTKTELGIGANEELQEIRLGAAGLCDNSDMCLLMIRTDQYAHFYTYHLSENGVIGKEYSSERYIVSNYKIELTCKASIFSNINPYRLFCFNSSFYMQKIELFILPDEDGTLDISVNRGASYRCGGNSDGLYLYKLKISPNDKYIYSLSSNPGYQKDFCIELDANGDNPEAKTYSYSGVYSSRDHAAALPSEKYSKVMFVYAYWEPINLYFDQKTVYLGQRGCYGDIYLTPDEEYIVVASGTNYTQSSGRLSENSLYIDLYSTSEVINANDGTYVQPIKSFKLYNESNLSGQTIHLTINQDGTTIRAFIERSSNSNNVDMWTLSGEVDQQKLVGVIYNGDFFRKVDSSLLSATASDVASGKTFIGSSGTIETGSAGS